MLLAKDEMGSDALILSIKSVKPKGFWRWFRRPYVEVTAALDENKEQRPVLPEDKELEEFKSFLSGLSQKQRELDAAEKAEKTEESAKAEKPLNIAGSLPVAVRPVKAEPATEPEKALGQVRAVKKPEPTEATEAAEPQVLIGQVIYEQLTENEVDERLANQLVAELLERGRGFSLEEGLNQVYRRLVKELSDIRPIRLENGRPRPVFFIGSTGVGKTTTIAKLASLFTLEKKCKVALITADTYRIAAVEQLRTYANILNIPIKVIYKEEEIAGCIEEFADYDLILIDTAGRSYQDTGHLQELKELLERVEDKQVYLVLSLSTKNSDLKKTVAAYDFTDFSLIFTKLDETLAYGSILNLKQETGRPLAYVTTGQNVPEDIAELDPYETANQILGGVSS